MKLNPGYYKLQDKTIFFEDMTPWDRGEISKILYDLEQHHYYEYILFPDHIVESMSWGGHEYIYIRVYDKSKGEPYYEFRRSIMEKSNIVHCLNYDDRLGKLLKGKLKVRKHNS